MDILPFVLGIVVVPPENPPIWLWMIIVVVMVSGFLLFGNTTFKLPFRTMVDWFLLFGNTVSKLPFRKKNN